MCIDGASMKPLPATAAEEAEGAGSIPGSARRCAGPHERDHERDGPQTVTKHGRDAVVVVSAEEYSRLRGGEPSLVEFIRSGPDLDALHLDRGEDRGRDVDL